MRLIDADALMHEFAEFVRVSKYSSVTNVPTWNDAVSLLGSAPTIEAEPKHGRWITEPIQTSARVPFPMERCSVCDRLSIERTNYCPNCGARMDGVEE